jgi:uncharacterized protein with HEPN domain
LSGTFVVTPGETFGKDDMVIDAVVRELEIIGEAARNVSVAFQESHPELPFAEMVGMRNRLIHAYFGVDLDVVWHTCQTDLQTLRDLLGPFVREPEPGTSGTGVAA